MVCHTLSIYDAYIDVGLSSYRGRQMTYIYFHHDERKRLIKLIEMSDPKYDVNQDPNWSIRCIQGHIYIGYWIVIAPGTTIVLTEGDTLRMESEVLFEVPQDGPVTIRVLYPDQVEKLPYQKPPKVNLMRKQPTRMCRFRGTYTA